VLIGLVVLTFNPGHLWKQWLRAVQKQQAFALGLVVDSSSTDNTNFDILPRGWEFLRIASTDFNHGGTRNLALQNMQSDTDVVVYMTQDALLADASAVETLVAAFENPEVACAFGRQLPHADATPVAAHARIFNYPATSRVVSLADKSQLGLAAFASAYRRGGVHDARRSVGRSWCLGAIGGGL